MVTCPRCDAFYDGDTDERCPEHMPPPEPCEVCHHLHDDDCSECHDWGGPCA